MVIRCMVANCALKGYKGERLYDVSELYIVGQAETFDEEEGVSLESSLVTFFKYIYFVM